MTNRLVALILLAVTVAFASDSPEGPKLPTKLHNVGGPPPDDPLPFYHTEIVLPGQTTRSPASGGEEGEGENDDGESEIESESGPGKKKCKFLSLWKIR